MLGLMQDRPLLISGLLDYAERYHAATEIVSRSNDGTEHRYGYGEAAARARRLAAALKAAGLRPGDRVATLAMNHYRHFELYFGVSGIGAVLHTVNPRLFAPQIEYVVNHGGSRIMFLDPAFVPLIDPLTPSLRHLTRYIVLCGPADLDAVGGSLPGMVDYESFLSEGSSCYAWPCFDERTASTLCYTSGTTGNPKGVLYSHRSTVLHALSACQRSSFDIAADSVLLAIPPMFHANAWSFPYLAAVAGAKLLLPGPKIDGESLQDLISKEGATFTVGVPTVFTMLLDYLRDTSLAGRDRRLRGAARDDRRVGRLWLHRASVVGHDGGESAGDHRYPDASRRRAGRTQALRCVVATGSGALGTRCADRQPGRLRGRERRKDGGIAMGPRSLDRERILW
jgi:acyl-CoA synthetase (AMP-forming)/AMP-acid ligase II